MPRKESDHNKAFYQLCTHMAADYHQLEFDLRLYLTFWNPTQLQNCLQSPPAPLAGRDPCF
jgi:hypothetical protein